MSNSNEIKENMKEFQERMRREYGPMYYDRQGKEISLMEWDEKFEDMEYKIVKQEYFDRWFISTMWIGLNMQFFRSLPIQIFETMIFLKEEKKEEYKEKYPLYRYQERYSTEEEAINGHEEAVALCRNQLLIEKEDDHG